MTLQWQKMVAELLEETKTIPLWGNAPAFPFDVFNETLKTRFEIPDLHVETRHVDWIPSGGWREGIGAEPTIFSFEAPLLKGSVFWVTPAEEMRTLSLAF